ncbi:serine/threonine-protein kinase [Lapillicoccus sp.]|uniref:serine/threonine-protein kinase n=1 Tax=Lapillicoccus sp. TaxID=1909287 RepID=UPI0025D80102|nr:serine/threonine-protein kinase [Lapillicoccus sp.]
MNPVEGLTLGSRYTLTERIAVGGMGEVWKARDSVLGRVVAVKVMRPHAAEEPAFADRFRDEARHTASLSHPNIATVYDYGEDDGAAYLVMELVDGQPLSELIARGPFAPDRVRSIVGQAALALAAAHAQGVVHRDVKPANILITSDGRVKLTDFGIASAGESASYTRTGEVLGTPHYLSPEQAVGRAATGSSDLYALGIVAHEMLTGTKPFDGGSAVATALSQVNDPPPPLPDTVPADLRRLVMSCLDKDPARRPESAAALAAALGMPVSGLADVDPATSVIHTGHTDPSATAIIVPAAIPTSAPPSATTVLPSRPPGPPSPDLFAEPDLGLRDEPITRRSDLRQVEEKKSKAAWWWAVPVVIALAAIGFLAYQYAKNSGTATPTPGQTITITGPAVTSTPSPSTPSTPSTTSTSSTSSTTSTSSTSVTPPPTAAVIDPNTYIGRNYADVSAALNKLGFSNLKTIPSQSDVTPGSVLAVDPNGNQPYGTLIVITYAKPAPSTTTTPPTPTTPATSGTPTTGTSATTPG